MQLHIVHPYVFKLLEDTLIMGPIKQFQKRDTKLNRLVTTALDSKVSVLHHKYSTGDHIESTLHYVGLSFDPLFDFLEDPRLETITTLPYGTPLPPERPETIPPETWTGMGDHWSSHAHVKEKIGAHSPLLFVGGTLDACLGGFLQYAHDFYPQEDRKLAYIPELCVIHDHEFWLTKMKPELDQRGISAMGYREALALVERQKK
ncbi:hypothetical protein J4210_06680 [Candidatus Woesearchaeota archaeon]|nr:hypothetical protein [Candidatus Woesearchaeota archaeon]